MAKLPSKTDISSNSGTLEQRLQALKRVRKLQSQSSLKKAWITGILVVASGSAILATDGNPIAIAGYLTSGFVCSMNLAKCIVSTFNYHAIDDKITTVKNSPHINSRVTTARLKHVLTAK